MEKKKTTRPYGQKKVAKHFRLVPELVRKLEETSKKRGLTETVYIQLALEAQLKKDGAL